MEAERRAVRPRGPGELHLVAVPEGRDGGDDRVELEVRLVADALERVPHLRGLVAQLRLVVEVLPAAATAGAEIRARGLDAVGAALQHLHGHCVAVPPLHLGDARAHPVARQGPIDEQHEVVEACNAASPEGERAHGELDLATSLGS
jgi:hypothetical protein